MASSSSVSHGSQSWSSGRDISDGAAQRLESSASSARSLSQSNVGAPSSPSSSLPAPTSAPWPRVTGWGFTLIALWVVLAIRLGLGVARGEPLKDDDFALPALGFLVITAVIGSRVFLLIQDRRHAIR